MYVQVVAQVSVAAPLMSGCMSSHPSGAVCLLASVIPEDTRWQLLNPASMKQALVEGAVRLPDLNLYEQGAGRINLVASKVCRHYHGQ